jgi:hypothetical protein
MRYLPALPVVLLLAISLCGQTTQNQPPAQKAMHQIFLEDQADLPGQGGKITEQEYYRRNESRKMAVRALLANGEAKTGEDFYDASHIFQHGNTTDDCLFAHILALEAIVHGYEPAKWLAAATLDRYLQLTNKPQVFGTQYPSDPNLPRVTTTPQAARLSGRSQEPYNSQIIPDPMRTDFCVPNLEQQKQNVATFNAGKMPNGTMRAPGCKN